MKRILILAFLFCISFSNVFGQQYFTLKDSLRGSLRPERTHFNILHYGLTIKIELEKRYITGKNKITFKVLDSLPLMQLDLFENMVIDSIIYNQSRLSFKRKFDAFFISFDEQLKIGSLQTIDVYYSGHPIVAKNAPWDGGFIFEKDSNGNHWIGVAVQGYGASLWYPNKDHLSDEPDEGADIKIIVPNHLMSVSNGRLLNKTDLGDGTSQWHWKVINPINNYNITVNIGDYVNFKDSFRDLDLDYYVLSGNEKKAKEHFQQVKTMMSCFYEKIGPYPFKEDSYKLVETPFLGMEHQSAIAYGNGFSNGYKGTDLSKTGYGLDWDFIIIHESGHEWFGNSISVADLADLWVHESFTTYSEAIFIECTKGKYEALSYLKGIRDKITNERPMIANYGVNQAGPGDIYFKGANMINTIRSLVNNDEIWWETMRKFTDKFKHRITNSDEVIDYFCNELNTEKLNLYPLFDQYLNYTKIPELEIRKKGWFRLEARWKVDTENFELPIIFKKAEKTKIQLVDKKWTKLNLRSRKIKNITIDSLAYYVNVTYLH